MFFGFKDHDLLLTSTGHMDDLMMALQRQCHSNHWQRKESRQ